MDDPKNDPRLDGAEALLMQQLVQKPTTTINELVSWQLGQLSQMGRNDALWYILSLVRDLLSRHVIRVTLSDGSEETFSIRRREPIDPEEVYTFTYKSAQCSSHKELELPDPWALY